MKAGSAPPWTTSFIDLCLLLLGFFVMLHAHTGQQAQVVNGIKQALGGNNGTSAGESHDIDPSALFEPNEALLKPAARRQIMALGRHAAAMHARVTIESIGADRAVRRFDGWELAAARTAAIARAVQAGGLSDQAITISIPEMSGRVTGKGQRIAIGITPR